ncbi:MAG: hypothetical protein ACREXV_06660 [Polaromonas sp.]
MNTDFGGLEKLHRWGESATHPIEPPWGTLAALLLLASKIGVRFQIRLSDFGQAKLRRFASQRNWNLTPNFVRALPAHPMTAHSGASNCRF